MYLDKLIRLAFTAKLGYNKNMYKKNGIFMSFKCPSQLS